MPPFSLTNVDIIKLFQSLQPMFFYKWIFLLFIASFIIFHLIVLNQIRSMDKIITQPLSSAILGFISLALISTGVILLVVVFSIRV